MEQDNSLPLRVLSQILEADLNKTLASNDLSDHAVSLTPPDNSGGADWPGWTVCLSIPVGADFLDSHLGFIGILQEFRRINGLQECPQDLARANPSTIRLTYKRVATPNVA